MLHTEKIEYLTQQASSAPEYATLLDIAITLAQELLSGKISRTQFHQQLCDAIAGDGHSRQFGYGFVLQLVDAYDDRQLLTETIHDLLEGIYTAITGDVAKAAILRFKNDPEDVDVLLDYVRSEWWLEEEFYSGRY